MDFKLPHKHINAIRPLFFYLEIFSITPWYNFDRNVRVKPKLNKLYGMFLIFARIILMVYSSFEEASKHAHQFLITQKILIFALYIDSVILCVVTILKTCFFDSNAWTQILSNIQHFDMKYKSIAKIGNGIFDNVTVQMIMTHGIFFGITGYVLYVWSHYIHMALWRFVVFSGFQEMYFEFLIFTLLKALIRTIKLKYEQLNQALVTTSKDSKTVETLRDLARDYRLLGETVDIFNKLFGHQMVLIIFHSGIQLVYCLNLLFILVTTQVDDFHYSFLLANCFLVTWMSYVFLSIVLPTNSIMNESRRFIDLLYQIQDEFPEESKQMKALKRLVGYAKNFRRGFSAAEFFTVNKCLVFSAIGNVATYLIISIQLNESQKMQPTGKM